MAALVAGVPTAPQLTSRHIYLVDKPEAAQSQIRIGWVGVPRSTADYATLEVLNTMLGGSFTSRLNQNLREKNGYAYGASSAFDMRQSAGPFFAAAGVQTDKTADALKEFFVELNGILTPIPADELAKAKNYVALGFPGEFETTGDLARKLEELVVYNLPDDTFSKFVSNVGAVTAADLQRAAARYVQPDKMAVVVVGDRKVIEGRSARSTSARSPMVPIDDLVSMTLTISLDELLAWTAEERAKWLPWLKANPAALDAPVQPGGRFPTVASLVDHIFLVEVRHTLRLQGKDLPTESHIRPGDIDGLFAYAERGRAAVHDYLPNAERRRRGHAARFRGRVRHVPLSPRKLLFHMALHEVGTGRRLRGGAHGGLCPSRAITICSIRRRLSSAPIAVIVAPARRWPCGRDLCGVARRRRPAHRTHARRRTKSSSAAAAAATSCPRSWRPNASSPTRRRT